jgi:hypothetical protein
MASEQSSSYCGLSDCTKTPEAGVNWDCIALKRCYSSQNCGMQHGPRPWLHRVQSHPLTVCKSTDVSEEHAVSIFRTEECAKQQTTVSACYLLEARLFLGSIFDPEDGGYVFLWNVRFQWTTRRYIPEGRTLIDPLITRRASYVWRMSSCSHNINRDMNHRTRK